MTQNTRLPLLVAFALASCVTGCEKTSPEVPEKTKTVSPASESRNAGSQEWGQQATQAEAPATPPAAAVPTSAPVSFEGTEFVEVLQIIAEPANHPLVFHCAAGKDRAGLVAATVLGLLEVDDDEIVADYAATEAALEALKERAMKRAASTGRPPAARFMTADAQTMRATLRWLHEAHGGFAPYLLAHGFTDGELALLRASLIERT